MKKILKNYAADAVLLIILGIILLIWPGQTLEVSCRIIGTALLLIGAVKIAQYFLDKNGDGRSLPDLLVGIVLALLGLWLIVNPAFFIGIVPYVTAVVIAYGAVISLVNAIRKKKENAPGSTAAIILAAVTLLLAVVVMLHPQVFSRIIVQLIGISLLVEGVTLIVAMSR